MIGETIMNEMLLAMWSREMKVESYKAIYEAVVSMSIDADGYGLFDSISDEDLEKCKWIAAINEVLEDVPMRRVKHIFNYRNVVFNSDDFLEENNV